MDQSKFRKQGNLLAGLPDLEIIQVQLDDLRRRMWREELPACNKRDPEVAKKIVVEILRSRRRRTALFGDGLFHEPAWDMLLELYLAELECRRISVSGLCDVSAVPSTTALRWISKLQQDGWVIRHDDPLDARRSWVALSEKGSAGMAEYVNSLRLGPTASKDST